jgi:hypothetical protein
MAAASMPSPKHRLLSELEGIEGFEALPSKVAGGTALFFKGKEFAHFHHNEEIDLRLTRKVINSMGLQHPQRSSHHPKRSASSNWIEVRFTNESEAIRVAELVKVAIEQL